MLTIHGNNQRIGVPFQPADEIAAIAVDSVEEGVLEVSEIEEQDAALEPWSQPKYFSLCCPFRVYPDGFRTIGNRTNDTGDFNARSDFLRPCGGPYLRKRFVQPDNRAVLDNQILKTIQFIAQNYLCSVSHLLSPRISASVPG